MGVVLELLNYELFITLNMLFDTNKEQQLLCKI